MAQQQTTPKTISINVSISGNLKYKGVNAAGVRGAKENAFIAGINPGDVIEWKCKKNYFIIDFGSHSPFNKLRYIGTKNKPISATVKDLEEQEKCPYKYSVTVFNSKGVKTCSDDPVLIIPPERGG